MSKIFLKKGKEESLKRYHPWIFSGAVLKRVGSPNEGDLVDVYSSEGAFLACGHFQEGTIMVRVLSFDESAHNNNFWEDKIRAAYNKRFVTGVCTNPSITNSYRLVNGEGDELPGLIIDIYNGNAVIQCHSIGMLKSINEISSAIKSIYGSDLSSVYNKSATTAPKRDGLEVSDGLIFGEGTSADIRENSVLFRVDWEAGQKTGFFLDQRENRNSVKKISKGKRVLNLFCYTGGFSIYALSGGAKSVVSVDSSSSAMALLEENLTLNIDAGTISANALHKGVRADAIEFLRNSADGEYDLMIVDPPAFAKHRSSVNNALRAYQRLNSMAISKVAPGGVIFTFSCSQAIDKDSFSKAIFSAAAQTSRKVSIIGRLTQPADHPVSIYHPEGEYLKGLVLFVE